jgi:hypothetical protein
MIVWGGYDGTFLNTGGQYDPVGNSWMVGGMTTTNAPTMRAVHTAVWTGSRMVVWGGGTAGSVSLNTGGLYDPVGNTWTATTTAGGSGAPTARNLHTAVWTGSRMIVWGGTSAGPTYFNDGGQYDPVGDSWTSTATGGAPAARLFHTAVWTGSKMIVWGGTDNTNYFNTGGQYDPVGNSWSSTTTSGVPAARAGHTAVWTGSKMIVWSGTPTGTTFLNSGGQYSVLSLYVKN